MFLTDGLAGWDNPPINDEKGHFIKEIYLILPPLQTMECLRFSVTVHYIVVGAGM